MTVKQIRTMFKSYEMQAEEELKGRVFSFSHQKAMGKHICALVNRDFDAGKFECWADAKKIIDTAWVKYLR